MKGCKLHNPPWSILGTLLLLGGVTEPAEGMKERASGQELFRTRESCLPSEPEKAAYLLSQCLTSANTYRKGSQARSEKQPHTEKNTEAALLPQHASKA